MARMNTHTEVHGTVSIDAQVTEWRVKESGNYMQLKITVHTDGGEYEFVCYGDHTYNDDETPNPFSEIFGGPDRVIDLRGPGQGD